MPSQSGPPSEMCAPQPLWPKPSDAPGVPVHDPTSATSNVTSIGSTASPGVANEIASVNDAVACVSAYGGKKLNTPELSPCAYTCSAPGVAMASASHVISPVGSGVTVPDVDALAESTPVFSWQPVQPQACASVLTGCARAPAHAASATRASAAPSCERRCMAILLANACDGTRCAHSAPRADTDRLRRRRALAGGAVARRRRRCAQQRRQRPRRRG